MTISKQLIKKLPKAEQDEVEKIVNAYSAKQNGCCALCDGTLDRINDDLALDHIVPEDDGGPTTLANLQLTHASCNFAKRNSATGDVRPYLRIKRFILDNGGRLSYDGVLPHFGIEPKESTLTVRPDGLLEAHLPSNDGSAQAAQTAPIYSEEVSPGVEVKYAYLALPRAAIFNDEAVQPRTVKVDHLNRIFIDLHKNPLHEPPSCRAEVSEGTSQILMFDGQHKTIASWMRGREWVVVKLYLDFPTESAIRLVNSIQAKIKKLSLSAFELAGKMSDEYKNQVSEYEASLDEDEEASEQGFIDWIDSEDRARARSALEAAIYQSVIDSNDLSLVQFVGKGKGFFLTETTMRNKVVKPLLYAKPLKEPQSKASKIRDVEASTAIRMINRVVEQMFEFPEDEEPTPAMEVKRQRASYQASLQVIFDLCRKIFMNVLAQEDTACPMYPEPTPEQWAQIEKAIDHVTNHALWTAEEKHKAMPPILTAMKENQNAKEAMEQVGLDLAYAISGPAASAAYNSVWAGGS
jgi:hypothetical protein